MWKRYSSYRLEQDPAGRKRLIPAADAAPLLYEPEKRKEELLLALLKLGKTAACETEEAADRELAAFADGFGLPESGALSLKRTDAGDAGRLLKTAKFFYDMLKEGKRALPCPAEEQPEGLLKLAYETLASALAAGSVHECRICGKLYLDPDPASETCCEWCAFTLHTRINRENTLAALNRAVVRRPEENS